jgi:Ser/Thr protein kinase RdoA (MazF antagonist)
MQEAAEFVAHLLLNFRDFSHLGTRKLLAFDTRLWPYLLAALSSVRKAEVK